MLRDNQCKDDGLIFHKGHVNGLDEWDALKKEGFNAVKGDFDVSSEKGIDLIDLPLFITGNLNIEGTNTTSLNDCPSCHSLNCAYNGLESLDGCPLSAVIVNASHNKITEMPALSQDMEWLDISYNQLSTLPGSYPKLTALYVSDNEFYKFEDFDIPDGLISSDQFDGTDNPITDALEILAQSDDVDMQLAVAKNTSLTPATFDYLRNKSNAKINHVLSKNPSAPTSFLDGLSRWGIPSLNVNIALNLNSDESILDYLSNEAEADGDNAILEAIAKNPRSPVFVLGRLFHSANRNRRNMQINLANNPNTPKNILVRLSSSSNDSMRRAVASNPNCPQEIIGFLATDSNKNISSAALSNPSYQPFIKSVEASGCSL